MKTALMLTLGRVVLCPIFLVTYLFSAGLGIPFIFVPYVLIFIATICELSDVFDGIIARKQKAVTDLGKILDPMADSIVKMSIFLSFTQGCVQLPLLVVLIFLVREAIVSALRTLCALRGIALAARPSGKIKTILQGVAIFIILTLMIPYSMGHISLAFFRETSFWVVLVTAIYAAASGVEYIWVYRSYIRESWTRVA